MSSDPLHDALAALAAGETDEARTALSLMLLDLSPDAIHRALPLHVLALVEFEHGNPDAARVLLTEAAAVERATGLETVALHTSHQLALLTQTGATVAHVGSYYKETYETLARMGQRQGAALCLKSMAEMYLAHGKIDGARGMIQRSAHLLHAVGDPAATHLAGWSAALGG